MTVTHVPVGGTHIDNGSVLAQLAQYGTYAWVDPRRPSAGSVSTYLRPGERIERILTDR
jgi:hypothetical protein